MSDFEPKFHQGYQTLPVQCYAAVTLNPAASPLIVHYNQELGEGLGLNPKFMLRAQAAQLFSSGPFPKSCTPIASAYGGHQFGQWAGLLGDGRATILGDLIDQNDKPWEIQLKGSGKTPYSRGGDGLATMASVLREYIMSEAMHALGVPTTRALAICDTGETVHRPDPITRQVKEHRGAVLTRVAPSHLRVGTFQYFYAQNDVDALRVLADYAIERHYPELSSATEYPNPYLALLDAVCENTARLVTHWMSLGFIHGVMNTDNTHIGGLTIDYGPCAFMDVFHPQKTFSSIDRNQRYSWANQVSIAEWNMNRLAQCFVPLLVEDGMAEEQVMEYFSTILDKMGDTLEISYQEKMGQKLAFGTVLNGPKSNSIDENLRDRAEKFIGQTMTLLMGEQLHYTAFFIAITRIAQDTTDTQLFQDQFTSNSESGQAGQSWLEQWQALRADIAAAEGKANDPSFYAAQMQQANPQYIAHNHLVAKAIEQAQDGDYSFFHRLVLALKTPFTVQDNMDDLQENPKPEQRVQATYCGT